MLKIFCLFSTCLQCHPNSSHQNLSYDDQRTVLRHRCRYISCSRNVNKDGNMTAILMNHNERYAESILNDDNNEMKFYVVKERLQTDRKLYLVMNKQTEIVSAFLNFYDHAS